MSPLASGEEETINLKFVPTFLGHELVEDLCVTDDKVEVLSSKVRKEDRLVDGVSVKDETLFHGDSLHYSLSFKLRLGKAIGYIIAYSRYVCSGLGHFGFHASWA